MKRNILKTIVYVAIAALFSSCEKEGNPAMVSEDAAPPVISAQNTTVVLSREVVNDTVATFTWTRADFGFSAGVLYTLEADKAGGDFSAPRSVTIGSFPVDVSPVKAFNGLDFNTLLLALNLPTGVTSQVQIRVRSEVNPLGTVQSPAASVAPLYSQPVLLTVTPFALTSFLYVPGAYQGWSPATADSLISPTSNGIYEGVIDFTPGNLGFKILTRKSWGPPEYGAGEAAGSIVAGGGDLAAPEAGALKLIVDLNEGTIEFSKHAWGIVGSSTPGGWETDTGMKYNNGARTWSITATLAAGALKFRLNNDWGVNLGGSNGSLSPNGPDIIITEPGRYHIELSTIENTYILTKL